MSWLARARTALADGGGARLITWVWVISWGEHAVSQGDHVAAQLAVAAAVVLVVAWEVTQDRLGSWGGAVGAALIVSALALAGGDQLRESSYLLGWGVVVLALTLRPRIGVPAIVLSATAAAWIWSGQGPAPQVPALLLGAASQFLVICLLQQLARTARRLRETQDRLAQSEVDGERDRLADELNTLIGQTLHQTAAQATQARALVADDPGVQRHLAEVEELVRRGLDQLALLSFEPLIDDFETEVRTAHTLCSRLGVAFNPSVDEVDDAASLTFALLLRESVTNMFKHAVPTRCTVVARQEGGAALFSFTNDGVPAVAETGVTGGGSGQARWRAQVSELGGSLEAGPLPGGRYRVQVRLPLPVPGPGPDVALQRSTHG